MSILAECFFLPSFTHSLPLPHGLCSTSASFPVVQREGQHGGMCDNGGDLEKK